MGYMTTVTVLNDGWDDIKNNSKEFISNIEKGMNGLPQFGSDRAKTIHSYAVGNHCNPMEVARSNHADELRLYLVGGNMMTTFGYANDLTDLALRKDLLKRAKAIIKNEERLIKELEQKKANLEKINIE